MTPLYPVALDQLDAPDILLRAPDQVSGRHTEYGERVMCSSIAPTTDTTAPRSFIRPTPTRAATALFTTTRSSTFTHTIATRFATICEAT